MRTWQEFWRMQPACCRQPARGRHPEKQIVAAEIQIQGTDMRFVQNFTPKDFQAKNSTLSISTNFNNLSDKNTKK